MKKFLLTLMIAVSAMSVMVSNTAEAKRMGGGGSSFGKQSSNVSKQAPAATPAPSQAAKPAAAPAPAGTPAKPASAWKGMLGGALLGLGLGALLSHFGLGGAMASMISTILMVALFAFAAMFIYRMIMRRKEGGNNAGGNFQPAYASNTSASNTPEIGSRIEPMHLQAQPSAFESAAGGSAGGMSAANGGATWEIPADFDVPAFLRNTKTYFIRLQAAWDKADTNDIREFTTPEMFGEIKLQLQERGASANHTDVVSLNAELLGIETQANEYLASVKFSGMIKESENAPAEPFTEVWNLAKPTNGQGGWILAGIQQVS